MDKSFAELSDELWKIVSPHLPKEPPKAEAGRAGRPRTLQDRDAFSGVIYRLKTGCQWRALPTQFGHWASVYARFRFWCASDGFEEAWKSMIEQYESQVGIDLSWTAIDGFLAKAPKGGTSRGRTPRTDRNLEPSAASSSMRTASRSPSS